MNLFIVLATGRNGHHAIINWLCTQHGDITHYNDLDAPYFNSRKLRVKRPPIVYGNGTHTMASLERFPVLKWQTLKQENSKYFEHVDNVQYILVIRRFRNWLASVMLQGNPPRCKTHNRLIKRPNAAHWIKTPGRYHQLLTAAINAEQHPELLVIRFDDWFTDKNYRQNICEYLHIPFTDAGLNKVAYFGNGSSFDEQTYDGKAQEMKVLERWKTGLEVKEYAETLEVYSILDELSEQYFTKPARVPCP